MADGRRYGGRHLTEILRAIRNIAEHWFHPQTAQEEAALEVCSLHIFNPVLALADTSSLTLLSRVPSGVDGQKRGGDTAWAGDGRGGGASSCGDREGVSMRWGQELCGAATSV
jgi:hypothetical protein